MATFIIAPHDSLSIKDGVVVITGARAFHSFPVAQLAADHERKTTGKQHNIWKLENVFTTQTLDEAIAQDQAEG